MMTQRVRTPEKNSCGQSRHEESCQFAPRGFARRREDSELDGRRQASPYSDFSFAKVSLFRPVQAKLAAARGGEEQEEDAASSEEWFDEDVGAAEPVQAKPEPNQTGMPDRLKAGIEMLSGIDMSDVRVHANSPKPARLNALAYTQGNQIYVGPGQERHLSHEAWHAVQQKQGRVRATGQMMGVEVNDKAGLEREAHMMADRAVNEGSVNANDLSNHFLPRYDLRKKEISINNDPIAQMLVTDEASDEDVKLLAPLLFIERIHDNTATTGKHNYAIDYDTLNIQKSSVNAHAEISLLALSRAVGQPDNRPDVTIVSEYKPCGPCRDTIEEAERRRNINVSVPYFLPFEAKGDGNAEEMCGFYKKLGYLKRPSKLRVYEVNQDFSQL